MISGPAGTGKSRACLEKLNILALLYPGAKGLIVRKTFASLGSTALQTYTKFVAKELIDIGSVYFHGGNAENPPQYRYDNGSTITVGGMDKSTRIMSSEYDIIYVQEAIELTENDWESLTTRLRNWVIPYQQIIADTNPDRPTHWLKQRDSLTILESRHEDNPILFTKTGEITEQGETYLAKLDALTGMRYHRLRKGLWVSSEGIVYDEYDPAAHLIDEFEIPWEWPRYWSIDFGYTNPFVCQMWARDDDGRLFKYREFYHTKRTVELHANKILNHLTDKDGVWKEPKPRRIICDHDREDRATFEKYIGLSTTNARKNVSEGIQAVKKRLAEKRIFFVRDSLVEVDEELKEASLPTCLEEEIGGYIWNELKDAPIKAQDHSMDCMRYLVEEIDRGFRPRVSVW